MAENELTETEMRQALMDQLQDRNLTEKLENQISSDIAVNVGEKVNIPYKIWLEPRDGLSKPRLQVRHFEQDIVFYTETTISDKNHLNLFNTTDPQIQVPLCILEMKRSGMTTENTLAYSSKAQQIKSIFPFSRYIVVTGNERKRKWEFHGEHFDMVRSLGGQHPDDWNVDAIEDELRDQFEIISDEIKTFESR